MILDHPIWAELSPFVTSDIKRGDGPLRVWVTHAPLPLLRRALAVTDACVKCGAHIAPVRLNTHDAVHQAYLSYTCELHARLGCSRSSEARDASYRMRQWLDGQPVPPPQADLFCTD